MENEEREAMLEQEAAEKREQQERSMQAARDAMIDKEAAEAAERRAEDAEDERSLDDLKAELIRALEERLVNEERKDLLENGDAEERERLFDTMAIERAAMLEEEAAEKRAQSEEFLA